MVPWQAFTSCPNFLGRALVACHVENHRLGMVVVAAGMGIEVNFRMKSTQTANQQLDGLRSEKM